MPGIQEPWDPEPPPHRTAEYEVQDVQPAEVDEAPPVRQLDGAVTRLGSIPFSGGTYCEVWMGQWAKGGHMDGGRGDVGEGQVKVEKVKLRLVTPTPLKQLFVGGLENGSGPRITGEGAQG